MNAYDRLCHTHDYNVTFERGNFTRQLARALGNVDALLRAGGASIEALSHFIVYLRDSSDYNVVEACFAESFSNVLRLILRGPLCRPEWLVEVEGVANDAPGLPVF